MHARDQEGLEERGAQKAEQADHAPVAAAERRSQRSTGETDEDERDGRDGTTKRGERDGGEEALGRLDRGVASTPEQGDEYQDRDDGGVGRPPSGVQAPACQRVFMSSGKLEEKEYDFTTP